jgi:hypothetical protein
MRARKGAPLMDSIREIADRPGTDWEPDDLALVRDYLDLHRAELVRTAFKRLGAVATVEDAEEMVQNALLDVERRYHRYVPSGDDRDDHDPNSCGIPRWVRSFVRRACDKRRPYLQRRHGSLSLTGSGDNSQPPERELRGAGLDPETTAVGMLACAEFVQQARRRAERWGPRLRPYTYALLDEYERTGSEPDGAELAERLGITPLNERKCRERARRLLAPICVECIGVEVLRSEVPEAALERVTGEDRRPEEQPASPAGGRGDAI